MYFKWLLVYSCLSQLFWHDYVTGILLTQTTFLFIVNLGCFESFSLCLFESFSLTASIVSVTDEWCSRSDCCYWLCYVLWRIYFLAHARENYRTSHWYLSWGRMLFLRAFSLMPGFLRYNSRSFMPSASLGFWYLRQSCNHVIGFDLFRTLECESPDRWEMDRVDSYQRKRLVLTSTLLWI